MGNFFPLLPDEIRESSGVSPIVHFERGEA